MADDGYLRPEFGLSDGWAAVNERAWNTPLYWVSHNAGWKQFTLAGLVPLDPTEPVNYYLTVIGLERLTISSSGYIKAPDLTADRFSITINTDAR